MFFVLLSPYLSTLQSHLTDAKCNYLLLTTQFLIEISIDATLNTFTKEEKVLKVYTIKHYLLGEK